MSHRLLLFQHLNWDDVWPAVWTLHSEVWAYSQSKYQKQHLVSILCYCNPIYEGGRREINVIKFPSVKLQILNLLVDLSHHRGGTKTEISYDIQTAALGPKRSLQGYWPYKDHKTRQPTNIYWNKLKHTSSTKGSSCLYSTWTYSGIRHYFFWLRQGSHAAWKQMGAIVVMMDTAPAEAWNIQPDLGKNTLWRS